jgi:hypothetical protein
LNDYLFVGILIYHGAFLAQLLLVLEFSEMLMATGIMQPKPKKNADNLMWRVEVGRRPMCSLYYFNYSGGWAYFVNTLEMFLKKCQWKAV